jgi:hypothetical protein
MGGTRRKGDENLVGRNSLSSQDLGGVREVFVSRPNFQTLLRDIAAERDQEIETPFSFVPQSRTV